MALETRADLSDAIAAWLNRSDLADRIPDFIRLAEARMNRLLRDPDAIITTLLTPADGSALLPDDYGQMVSVGMPESRLAQVSPGEFASYTLQSGIARVYTLVGGDLKLLPSNQSPLPVSYYRGLSPLVGDSDTNWLLKRAPDLYLYGALLQAEFYGWNDDRLGTIKAAWDEGVAELRVDSESRRWGSGPLAPRIRRS